MNLEQLKDWQKSGREALLERRTFEFQLRAAEDAPQIVGHAALFNVEADLGHFRESIAPGAFSQAIQQDDVRALFNHDPNFVLGRNTAGTLRMSEDEKGLAVEIDPPATQWASDLQVSMRRGDITQMSFGFIAKEQRVEKRDGVLHRVITRAQLFDVSPVTYPAYKQTDVAVRSAQDIFEEITEELRNSEASTEPVPSEPIPATQPEPEPVDFEAILEVQRKRLQLIG